MAVQHRLIYDRPNEEDAQLAATGSRVLAACTGTGDTATLRIIANGTDITVPVKAIEMLASILDQMALGKAISIVPSDKELTTQQAADMLNVSRPYLIGQILDQQKLPFHHVGNRRKIFFRDVIEFKKRQELQTDEVMAELAELSQAMGIMD